MIFLTHLAFFYVIVLEGSRAQDVMEEKRSRDSKLNVKMLMQN